MSLLYRQLLPELMDDPKLDEGEHRRALRGLARLNRVSRSAELIRGAIGDLVPVHGAAPLRVLDVATGAGDVPRSLDALGAAIVVDGCDRSATAVDVARAVRGAGGAARMFTLDALEDPIPDGYDVIVCSLFLHHLETGAAARLVRRLAAAAGRRLVINDLERSRLNLVLVTLAAHILTRSRVVHVDGPRSVRAAFTMRELSDLARQAGIPDAIVARRFPCRLLLTWNRP